MDVVREERDGRNVRRARHFVRCLMCSVGETWGGPAGSCLLGGEVSSVEQNPGSDGEGSGSTATGGKGKGGGRQPEIISVFFSVVPGTETGGGMGPYLNQ